MVTAGAAQAEYPERAINMVVPFAAGGPTDNVARSLAEAMRPTLGQTVVVENKGGAGGTIGTTQVARAQPDGYSVLLMHAGFSTAPRCTRTPATIPQELRAHRPGGRCADDHHRPFRLPAQQHPRAGRVRQKNKDKVSLANAGIGAASHLCGTMLVEALGVQLLTIPYKGTAPAMNDLLGKQVDLLCDQTTNTTQQINAGSVKAYAVTSLQRVPTLSKLPTMDESGFKGFEVGIWHGMWVPKGTPKPVVDKLIKACRPAWPTPSSRTA